jgi:hypothetical protein
MYTVKKGYVFLKIGLSTKCFGKLSLYTVKRLSIFLSPVGMSLTKLLPNLIIPGKGEFG